MEFVAYDIASNDFRRAGAASRAIKERLKRIGADAEAIRRTMIAAYEAEMNVVIHSQGGRLEASLSDSQIDVNVVDGGPGIPDIEQAMIEGFSTASPEARALGFGAGMGLPNIKKNSDRLRVTSRKGEGTRVSFTVYLRPESTDGPRPISLYASADRCRDCRACLSACPTGAMRVRDGRPSVLEHLCIDCAACIAACTSDALTMRDELSSLDDLPGKEEMLLVVPPALLAGCGADYSPGQVLTALRSLGFAEVITSAAYESILRDAVVAAAAEAAVPAGATAAPGTVPAMRLPLIMPSCPAIVNLIELRFPSLVPHLARFDSPWEAIEAVHGDRPVAYVVSCPGQRSALVAHAQPAAGTADGDASPTAARDGAAAPAEYIAPDLVRQSVMAVLTHSDGESETGAAGPGLVATGAAAAAERADTLGADAAKAAGAADAADAPAARVAGDPAALEPLTVTGVAHVMAVLEQIEDGLLTDVRVVDPYACEGGCFGSPLLFEDHHVATLRWQRGHEVVEAAEASAATAPAAQAIVATGVAAGTAAAAVPRRHAFTARPGIRLDSDMSRAILKLGRMQAVIASLPGRDCGACGAPTCAALAEDIVMERAGLESCPYVETETGEKEDQDP